LLGRAMTKHKIRDMIWLGSWPSFPFRSSDLKIFLRPDVSGVTDDSSWPPLGAPEKLTWSLTSNFCTCPRVSHSCMN
jgi:hypothetical protein